MKKALFFFCLVTIVGNIQGQRYLDEVFSGVNKMSNIQYGQAERFNGTSLNLEMDIFEPSGDTISNRPLIIMAHGGSFVAGDRSDLKSICKNFARRGYVAATISYRLGVDPLNILNLNEELLKAASRATQDFNAAIRFFYQSARDRGNPYNIDTSKIIAGGYSAGAISAIHSQLFIDTSSANKSLRDIVRDLGGIKGGNSGSLGYPDRTMGLWNIAGAIYDSNMINTAHVACISFHGDSDDVVPYAVGPVSFISLNVMEMHGSSIIHSKLKKLGAPAVSMNTFIGAEHDIISNVNRFDTIVNRTARFFHPFLVPKSGISLSETKSTEIFFYPNPVFDGVLYIQSNAASTYTLLDMVGRICKEGHIKMGKNTLLLSGILPGLYHLQFGGKSFRLVIN